MSLTRRALPAAWAVLLGAVLLGPGLGWGYVLSYDMVWVPDLTLRPDFLGLGSALPRAVPSDAVVSVADVVIPGMLLQKVVLLGSLAVAGAGGAALVPALSLPARCFAASLFVWNPFVAERLVLGHWPVLIGYAVLPWLLVVGRRLRTAERSLATLLPLLAIGSLSASAGLVSAVAVLAVALQGRLRPDLRLVAALAAANAPWVVAGLLHSGVAATDRSGAEVFALHGEGLLPGPLAALSLGGVWNADVVPATRTGPLAVVALVLLLALGALGLRSWLADTARRDRWALVVCWAVGWTVAVQSWAAPGINAALATLPGGGLLRDGSRLLGLCVPLLAVLGAYGVQRLGEHIGPGRQQQLTCALLALAPLALMPDAAWGVSGRLRAVDYPASYDVVREAVGDADGTNVLVLPFSSFRAPDWNGGRKVLDPLGRYLRPDYVASDVLVVSGVVVDGEDPLVKEVRDALALSSAAERSRELARLGIGVVVTDSSAPGRVPELAGTPVVASGDLSAIALEGPRDTPAPRSWVVAMALAWSAWIGCSVAGIAASLAARALRTRRTHTGAAPRAGG